VSSTTVPARAPSESRDAGNAALELVILAPVLLFVLGLVIAAGRTSVAQGSVAAAARDAARQASIALTPAAARTAALTSARAALGQDGLTCDPVVRVNVTGFGVPVGQPATVQAVVSCRVSLSSLMVPGMPGSRTLRAAFTSPLDPYRER
jgi:Flp pilus assembly protein TadG